MNAGEGWITIGAMEEATGWTEAEVHAKIKDGTLEAWPHDEGDPGDPMVRRSAFPKA